MDEKESFLFMSSNVAKGEKGLGEGRAMIGVVCIGNARVIDTRCDQQQSAG